jgi:hypothetical protein
LLAAKRRGRRDDRRWEGCQFAFNNGSASKHWKNGKRRIIQVRRISSECPDLNALLLMMM